MPQKLKFKKYRSWGIETNAGISKKPIAGGGAKPGPSKAHKGSFGKKLESRRLFALLYGNISHTQYTRLFSQAEKYPGKIGIQFLSLVEKRLDVVVTKMFFFPTLDSARQYISHKGILVNKKIVNVASAFVKPGDIIQIKNPVEFASWGSNRTQIPEAQSFVKHPHLEVNYKTLTGIFLFSPHQIYYTLPKLRCTEAGISLDI